MKSFKIDLTKQSILSLINLLKQLESNRIKYPDSLYSLSSIVDLKQLIEASIFAYYQQQRKLDNRTTLEHIHLELLQDLGISTIRELAKLLN